MKIAEQYHAQHMKRLAEKVEARNTAHRLMNNLLLKLNQTGILHEWVGKKILLINGVSLTGPFLTALDKIEFYRNETRHHNMQINSSGRLGGDPETTRSLWLTVRVSHPANKNADYRLGMVNGAGVLTQVAQGFRADEGISLLPENLTPEAVMKARNEVREAENALSEAQDRLCGMGTHDND